MYGTWAIAHGDTACAYPGVTFEGYPVIAPLYLLASGAIAAVTRIGHTVAFPSAAALGPGCDKAFVAMNRWSVHAGALGPTAWIGCAAWLVLMFGVVAWLRASGRGRRGWEPVTLVVVACLPPVWMCVELAFHPQDLMALGFALAALACARRDRWIGAGFLVALAVLSQQYALLVAAPLLVLAPPTRRIRYAAAALATAAIVDIPLLIVTSTGHALRAITLGTGDNASIGGTMLWELHLHGASVVLLSRVAPIAVAMALTWWVSRRHGPAALQPVLLMSVVAVSLGLRLVFEQNIFAYYFMALAVCVVLLDVARGHLRSATVAWLSAGVLVFCFFRGVSFVSLGVGGYVSSLGPLLFLIPAVALMLLSSGPVGSTRNKLPWLGVAVCALLTWPGHAPPYGLQSVAWFWQVVLVLTGIMLAASPLLTDMRTGSPVPRAPDPVTVSVGE